MNLELHDKFYAYLTEKTVDGDDKNAIPQVEEFAYLNHIDPLTIYLDDSMKELVDYCRLKAIVNLKKGSLSRALDKSMANKMLRDLQPSNATFYSDILDVMAEKRESIALNATDIEKNENHNA